MNTKRKILSILLTAILLLSNLSVTATAADMFSIYSVTKFSTLPNNVSEQSVPLGTSLNALTLPDTLTASILTESNIEEETTISGITWDSVYNPDSFGDYFFTAVLPQGYTPADGVLLPVITITVEKAEMVGSRARTTNITLTVTFNGTDMQADIATALATGGAPDKADVTTIKVTGSATTISGGNWSYLIELFADGSWGVLNTLDLSDMGGLTEIGTPTSTPPANNNMLTTVMLPDGVTTIGQNAFANCTGITELTLPSALNAIGATAFENCSSLSSITFMGNAPTIGTNAFNWIADPVNIYVPLNSTGYDDTLMSNSGFLFYTIYTTSRPNVTFTANPSSVNLANPTAIELKASDLSLRGPYTYHSLSFKNLTEGRDYSMTFDAGNSWYGMIYTPTTGILTIPATAFSPSADPSHAHSVGALLTPGSYRAKIEFEDSGGNLFFYEVDFSLTDSQVKYRLTVQEGTGGGNYEKGKAVTIKANAAPEGKIFDRWESNNGGTFADADSETTIFTMPGKNVTVTAVYRELHSLTVKNGLGSGNYEKDEIVTIGANPPPMGTVFDRWITDNGGTFADSDSEVTTFTMPGNNVTVTAVYSNIDNGGGSIPYENNNTITPPPASEYIICNTVKIEYSRKNALLSSDIIAETFSSIVDKALKDTDGSKTIKMDFSTISGASSLHSLALTFDAEYIKEGENITFIIETPFGVFIFTTEQMADWFDERFGKYIVTLEKSSLKVDVSKGGKSVKWDDLTPMARIGVPYRLKTGENASNVVVTDKNSRVLPTSVYENGMIYADIFDSGKYNSIAKKPVTYTDTARHWAKADIDFTTMRGLIGSNQSNIYNTDTAITRADYLMSLGKLSGADISSYKKSSFSDVSNYSEAMPYIEWAVLNDIVVGIGENKFAPDSPITREEMSQMMRNYARALGFELPVINSPFDYADSSDISEWANEAVISMQKASIMTGKNNNMFDPQGNTTRAESVAILRRFIEYVISSRYAEGWSNDNNDLKKRVYYNQNGVSLTGWQNIDGDMYYFYKNGTLAVNTTIEGYKVDKNGVRKD